MVLFRRMVVCALAAFGVVGQQPDLTAVRSDFVPGERVIFYDDFTDMNGDEPPPHWKARGKAELRVGGAVRQLTLTEATAMLTANVKGLPKNFTMETEVKFENFATARGNWHFVKKDGYESLRLSMDADQLERVVRVQLDTGDPREASETVGKATAPADWAQTVKQSLWVQDGRVRVYINGERVIDVNQVETGEIASVEFKIGLDDTPKAGVGLRMVRVAESAPDFSKVITSAGRWVTHGILFDTDSDRIKAESAAAIRAVAKTLEANAALKLRIEGHTDSSGDAAHNLDLSKRRAESVKAVLVSQFKVEAGRLTTAGMGATKPLEGNETAKGRAQNRRVEFVRE